MTLLSTGSDPSSSLTNAHFMHLREIVRNDSAILLEPGKEYLVESRLSPLVRREGFGDLGSLVDHLRSNPRSPLRADVIDAMTTNETSFFRDLHPWHALRDVVLPELIAARRDTRRLDVWCAAASSGQEPYTLAMMLAGDFAEELAGWTVRILATDISPSMVKRCRDGSFSQLEVNRGLPAPLLPRWFHREGAVWRIDEAIRKMVVTQVGNLADRASLSWIGRVDLVLMRNVLIYFDQATKTRIVTDTLGRMRPGGVLMFGSAEVSSGVEHGLTRHQTGKTVFFRRT